MKNCKVTANWPTGNTIEALSLIPIINGEPEEFLHPAAFNIAVKIIERNDRCCGTLPRTIPCQITQVLADRVTIAVPEKGQRDGIFDIVLTYNKQTEDPTVDNGRTVRFDRAINFYSRNCDKCSTAENPQIDIPDFEITASVDFPGGGGGTQVQADMMVTDETDPAYVHNKENWLEDTLEAGDNVEIEPVDGKLRISASGGGAEPVQSDMQETDPESAAYIKNKLAWLLATVMAGGNIDIQEVDGQLVISVDTEGLGDTFVKKAGDIMTGDLQVKNIKRTDATSTIGGQNELFGSGGIANFFVNTLRAGSGANILVASPARTQNIYPDSETRDLGGQTFQYARGFIKALFAASLQNGTSGQAIQVLSNLDFANNVKLLFSETDEDGNTADYAICFIGDYVNVEGPDGTVYARWLQTEFGNTHIPMNLNTANNPITGKYIGYDVGAWILDEENYPAMAKQFLATFTEGSLNLESKYFTPVDNGSGGLTLDGLTYTEIAVAYLKYQAGLQVVNTNTPGWIGATVTAFYESANAIVMSYRFAIVDYNTGVISVYNVQLTASSVAPVNVQVTLLYTFSGTDVLNRLTALENEAGAWTSRVSGVLTAVNSNIPIKVHPTLNLNGFIIRNTNYEYVLQFTNLTGGPVIVTYMYQYIPEGSPTSPVSVIDSVTSQNNSYLNLSIGQIGRYTGKFRIGASGKDSYSFKVEVFSNGYLEAEITQTLPDNQDDI